MVQNKVSDLSSGHYEPTPTEIKETRTIAPVVLLVRKLSFKKRFSLISSIYCTNLNVRLINAATRKPGNRPFCILSSVNDILFPFSLAPKVPVTGYFYYSSPVPVPQTTADCNYLLHDGSIKRSFRISFACAPPRGRP